MKAESSTIDILLDCSNCPAYCFDWILRDRIWEEKSHGTSNVLRSYLHTVCCAEVAWHLKPLNALAISTSYRVERVYGYKISRRPAGREPMEGLSEP